MKYGVAKTTDLKYEVVELHTPGQCSCIIHSASLEAVQGVAEAYTNPEPDRDPYRFLRRQQRAENREDLVLANERRLVQSGDLSVENTMSYSELRRLERATRGESIRTEG